MSGNQEDSYHQNLNDGTLISDFQPLEMWEMPISAAQCVVFCWAAWVNWETNRWFLIKTIKPEGSEMAYSKWWKKKAFNREFSIWQNCPCWRSTGQGMASGCLYQLGSNLLQVTENPAISGTHDKDFVSCNKKIQIGIMAPLCCKGPNLLFSWFAILNIGPLSSWLQDGCFTSRDCNCISGRKKGECKHKGFF